MPMGDWPYSRRERCVMAAAAVILSGSFLTLAGWILLVLVGIVPSPGGR